jgi:biopolymer transport protein ExbD
VTPEFTLTPLIDILFIVLIFLVLTTSFREISGIRLNLPETDTGRAIAEVDDLYRLTVAADGTIAFGGDDALTLDALEARLVEIPDKEGVRVVLAADVAASHGRVVAVMDHIRRAGIFRLEIETLTTPP